MVALRPLFESVEVLLRCPELGRPVNRTLSSFLPPFTALCPGPSFFVTGLECGKYPSRLRFTKYLAPHALHKTGFSSGLYSSPAQASKTWAWCPLMNVHNLSGQLVGRPMDIFRPVFAPFSPANTGGGHAVPAGATAARPHSTREAQRCSMNWQSVQGSDHV